MSQYGQIEMRLPVAVITLFVVFSGCAYHRGPEEEVHFARVTELQAVYGIFENEGDPSGKLSHTFFGYEPIQDNRSELDITHDEIDIIEISPIEKGLLVKAIKGGCVVTEKELLLERDFKLEDGKLVIETDTHLLTRGAGDITVGPSTSKTMLGIDVEGNLIWKRQDYAAVLVGFVIPAFISDIVELRFARVGADEGTTYGRCESEE